MRLMYLKWQLRADHSGCQSSTAKSGRSFSKGDEGGRVPEELHREAVNTREHRARWGGGGARRGDNRGWGWLPGPTHFRRCGAGANPALRTARCLTNAPAGAEWGRHFGSREGHSG